ncbi:MAG: glycosyltransferase family 39 protein [Chloroflexi bacterium]|nr:glycosyltransferase family 39 protein [Chloroflexota bacterium]
MSQKNWLWLLAILLLATALRFYLVAQMPLRADEASNIFLATQEPDAIMRPFIAEDPHLPLFFWLLHYWMLVAGSSELAARFLPISAGIVVVALTYVLGRQLFPAQKNIPIIATLLAAVNPYLIWDAQDAYMYSFLAAITLFSFISFMRVMQPRASRRHWASYIVANALGLFVHYLAGLVLIAQGILWLAWIITRRITTRRAGEWIIAQVITVGLYFPWLIFVFPLLANFKLNFFPPATFFEMLARSLIAFSVGRVDGRLMPPMIDPPMGGILAIGFLLIFVLGLFGSSTFDDKYARFMLVVYLSIPLVVIFLFSIWRFPIFDERYVLFLIPPFLLVVARGVTLLRVMSATKWMASGAMVFMLAASGFSLNNYFHVPAYAKSPDWHSFMRRVAADARAGDVMIQNYPDPALPYYLNNRMQRVLLPRTNSSTASEVDADLARLTTKFTRVWFQPSPFAEWDTDGLVANWLHRHARAMNAYSFRGVQLELYLSMADALRQATPSDATFFNQMQLLAFDSDAALVRSGVFRLNLYWKLLEHSDRDATVFVHLYDASGKLWSQQDNQPVGGTYPHSQWQLGEGVVDSYALQIPADAPSGKYFLIVGMYDSQTQVRLQVNGSENQLLLRSFEVAP